MAPASKPQAIILSCGLISDRFQDVTHPDSPALQWNRKDSFQARLGLRGRDHLCYVHGPESHPEIQLK